MSQTIGKITVDVTVKVAWWLIPYVRLLSAFAYLTGMEPDQVKLSRTIERALTVKLGNVK